VLSQESLVASPKSSLLTFDLGLKTSDLRQSAIYE